MEGFEELIQYTVHAYMRDLLGNTVYLAITILFIVLGFILLVASVANSNILLGNPTYRDKSNLGDIEYLKMRRILRIILGIVGIAIMIYNLVGLMA